MLIFFKLKIEEIVVDDPDYMGS